MRLAALLSAVVLVASATAAAEPSKDDVAKAIALFKEGRALEKKGDVATACAKFEESESLAPAPGTQLNIAVCHAQLGRDLEAYDELKIGIARAIADKRADRQEIAEDWLRKVEARVAIVTITRADPNETVTIDGVEVASFDVERAIAPGEHAIEAHADGKRAWSTKVAWKAGEHANVAVPALESEAVSTPSPIAPPTSKPIAGGAGEKLVDRPESAPSTTTWRAPVGITSMALGAASLGVGAYLFAKSFSLNHEAQDIANLGRSHEAEAESKNDSARSARTWSYVAFGAGAALGAVGAWFYFGKSNDERATATRLVPMVGLGGGGVALGGAF